MYIFLLRDFTGIETTCFILFCALITIEVIDCVWCFSTAYEFNKRIRNELQLHQKL